MPRKKEYYYVKVNGERWSPVVSHEKAMTYFNKAIEIFRIEKGLTTVQLVHIERQLLVGRG